MRPVSFRPYPRTVMRATAAQMLRVLARSTGFVTIIAPASTNTPRSRPEVNEMITEPTSIETEKSTFLSLRATMRKNATMTPITDNIKDPVVLLSFHGPI